jgi:hypothetical protein
MKATRNALREICGGHAALFELAAGVGNVNAGQRSQSTRRNRFDLFTRSGAPTLQRIRYRSLAQVQIRIQKTAYRLSVCAVAGPWATAESRRKGLVRGREQIVHREPAGWNIAGLQILGDRRDAVVGGQHHEHLG